MSVAAVSIPLQASISAPVLRVVCDEREWDALEGEWNELFDASPTAAPPLRFEWLREWWRLFGPVYGDRGSGLRVYTVRRGSQLVGALPLYVGARSRLPTAPRRLGFLSTGEAETEETCAAYLDLLHLPGAAAECLEEIQAALFHPRDGSWDELDLSRLSGRSPLVAWSTTAPASYRRSCVTGAASQIADLSGGFEAYLGRLSSNSRAQARRLLRQSVEAGAVLELAGDAETAERFLDELVELHQARWQAAGKPGCFAAPRFTELHRSLIRRWVPTGDAVLARLSHAGSPLAVVLGYVARGKFDYYISGARMDDGPVRSPGIAAHLLLKRRLAEQGITHYDYMGGSYRYKQQFATYEHPVTRLRLTRPTLRSGIHLAGSFAVRAVRKAVRVAAGGIARPEVAK